MGVAVVVCGVVALSGSGLMRYRHKLYQGALSIV